MEGSNVTLITENEGIDPVRENDGSNENINNPDEVLEDSLDDLVSDETEREMSEEVSLSEMEDIDSEASDISEESDAFSEIE